MPGHIPGRGVKRATKTLLRLPKGSHSLVGQLLSSQAGGAADHPQTNEGEKLQLLNRLNSFSHPAQGPGRAAGMLPGALRAEPRSPQPWAQHCSRGPLSAQPEHDHRAAATSDAGLCHTAHNRHGSQQDKPGWGSTDEPAISLAEWVAQRGEGLKLHPTTQWNSSLQEDCLN